MSSLILNLDGIWYSVISRCTTLNHRRVNIKHSLGPILGAEVAQKRAPFPAVVTRTEMGNANICILCDAVKNVERRVLSLLWLPVKSDFLVDFVKRHFLDACIRGRQTLRLAVNAVLLWGNCILAMKNRQKIRPKRPETDIKLNFWWVRRRNWRDCLLLSSDWKH